MQEFIEIPCTKVSLSKRKLVYGIGINDATYQVSPTINNKKVRCKYYITWKSMLRRCYDQTYHDKQATYKDCIVCEDWKIFSNFKAWMITQDWQENSLDKDLLIYGNKLYSPETCVFVSQRLNTLLINNKEKRGNLLLGVTLHKNGKYQAYCSDNLVSNYLGIYDTEQEAHDVYCLYKADLIKKIAEEQTDIRIKNALIERANRINLEE